MVLVIILNSCNLKDDNIIYLNLKSEPHNLDPQTVKDESAQIILNNIFEGLFIVKEDGTIENGAAKQIIKSEDGLSYEITIRDDILWSNGQKLTSDDFIFGLKRILLPETKSQVASRYYFLKNARQIHENNISSDELGVKALSSTVIKFTLEYQNDNFILDMASPYVLPCNEEFFLSTKGKYGLDVNNIISNGPYTLSEWKKNEHISLVKNQQYFDSKNVFTNKIIFHTNPDFDIAGGLLDENIHAGVVDGIQAQDILNQEFNYEIIDKKQWGIYVNQNNEFLSNSNIRKAIINSFDHSSYANHIPKSLEIKYDLIPDGMNEDLLYYRDSVGYNQTMYNTKDVDQYMKKGLTELGILKIPTITLLINKEYDIDFKEHFSYPSQILQKELGIFINIKELDAKDFKSAITSKKFDMAIIPIDGSKNSITQILESFVTNNIRNYISYSNKEYDRLYNEIKNKDIKERFGIYQKMEQIILEDGIFIPIYKSFDYFFTNNDFKDIKYNHYNSLIYLKDAKRGG